MGSLGGSSGGFQKVTSNNPSNFKSQVLSSNRPNLGNSAAQKVAPQGNNNLAKDTFNKSNFDKKAGNVMGSKGFAKGEPHPKAPGGFKLPGNMKSMPYKTGNFFCGTPGYNKGCWSPGYGCWKPGFGCHNHFGFGWGCHWNHCWNVGCHTYPWWNTYYAPCYQYYTPCYTVGVSCSPVFYTAAEVVVPSVVVETVPALQETVPAEQMAMASITDSATATTEEAGLATDASFLTETVLVKK